MRLSEPIARGNDASVAGILMIVSGVFTAVASFWIVMTWGWVCIGTLWVLPMGIGVVEAVVGASLIGGAAKPSVRTIATLGLLSAIVSFNAIGVVLELANQVLLRGDGAPGWLDPK